MKIKFILLFFIGFLSFFGDAFATDNQLFTESLEISKRSCTSIIDYTQKKVNKIKMANDFDHKTQKEQEKIIFNINKQFNENMPNLSKKYKVCEQEFLPLIESNDKIDEYEMSIIINKLLNYSTKINQNKELDYLFNI